MPSDAQAEARYGNGRTYATFAIVTLACALGSLTQTVVNAMLGGIQSSFGTAESVSQWLTTVYMLVIGITVPLVAHLSRRYSVRTLTLASLVFTFVGALGAALAPAFSVLFVGRVLQAIGCGITLPIVQTIAMVYFPSNQNATAMGIAGIAMGFAPNIGPLIGGALVDTLGWRSFFWMLAGFIVLLVVFALAVIPKESQGAHDARLDFASFMLSTLGFGGLLLSFSNASGSSVASLDVWLPAVIGTACLIAFFVRQNRIEHPLISLRIFKSSTYVASFVMQNLLFASFMGITLVLPLFAINICGFGPVDAGLIFLPTTLLAIVFNPLAGILSDKIGVRPVVVAASAMLAIGATSMAFVSSDTPLWLLMVLQAVRGIGVSSLIGPLNSWGMSRLEPACMVDGSAFFTTVRQACASLGTALMMMLVGVFGGAAVGYNMALGLSAVLSIAVFVLAVAKAKNITPHTN